MIMSRDFLYSDLGFKTWESPRCSEGSGGSLQRELVSLEYEQHRVAEITQSYLPILLFTGNLLVIYQ